MQIPQASNAEIAQKAARLWPHREHESNIVLSQLCRLGLHHWKRLDLTKLAPGKNIRHCFWCSKVEIDGTVYEA